MPPVSTVSTGVAVRRDLPRCAGAADAKAQFKRKIDDAGLKDPMPSTDSAPPKTLCCRPAKETGRGFPTYDLRVIRFIKGQFGRYDNKADGYSLRVRYDNFPGMNVRYVEGPRTMNVFGELMANLKDLHLDLST